MSTTSNPWLHPRPVNVSTSAYCCAAGGHMLLPCKHCPFRADVCRSTEWSTSTRVLHSSDASCLGCSTFSTLDHKRHPLASPILAVQSVRTQEAQDNAHAIFRCYRLIPHRNLSQAASIPQLLLESTFKRTKPIKYLPITTSSCWDA